MTGEQEEEPRRAAYDAFTAAHSLGAEGRHEEAVTAYRRALDLYRGLPDSEQQQASCLHDIGVALRATGNDEEAVAAYRQAADLYRCLSGNERDQADCLYHVADILDTTGRQEEAASD